MDFRVGAVSHKITEKFKVEIYLQFFFSFFPLGNRDWTDGIGLNSLNY